MMHTPKQRLEVIDRFYPKAKEMRKHFELRFKDPRSADGSRFVWDYWVIYNQYRLLRTPAWEFFPKGLFDDFYESLVLWGRRHLGCHGISPPWMSLYTDGHYQNLHADVPHGPWAYVFSLTSETVRVFEGGNTMLLKPSTLQYWQKLNTTKSRSKQGPQELEQKQLVDLVEPEFNRLTLFDPRIPHGVERMKGAEDPREGRLVIHGWFVDPRPYWEGPLTAAQLRMPVQKFINALSAEFVGRVSGALTLGVTIEPSGKVGSIKFLTHQWIDVKEGDYFAMKPLTKAIENYQDILQFPKRAQKTRLTLPVLL